MVAPRGPGQGLLWGLTAALRACGQKRGLGYHPLPRPAHLWWDPIAPHVAPQRNNPQYRSRDGRDNVNGQGRTEGALGAVQIKWSGPATTAPDRRWDRSNFWAISPRQPLMMRGALLASPCEVLQPPRTDAPTWKPGQPQHSRTDQIVLTDTWT